MNTTKPKTAASQELLQNKLKNYTVLATQVETQSSPSITLIGQELSGRQVIVIFREHSSACDRRMLAGDILRSPQLVERLTNIDLATIGKLYALEFGEDDG